MISRSCKSDYVPPAFSKVLPSLAERTRQTADRYRKRRGDAECHRAAHEIQVHRVLRSKDGQVMGKRPRMRRKCRIGRSCLSAYHYSKFIRQPEIRITLPHLPRMRADGGPFFNNEFRDLVKQVIQNVLEKPSGQLANPVHAVCKYWLPEASRKIVTEEAFNVDDFS